MQPVLPNFTSSLLLVLILLLSWNINAQCIADAGPDQHWCRAIETEDTLVLGSPASGGTPPYQYEWSITPIQLAGSNLTFHASHFLNDTTIATPRLIESHGYQMEFHLKVTDANGLSCYDSTKLTISRFSEHMTYYHYIIRQGDSVYLKPPNVGTINPLSNVDSIVWRPNRGLSDSNAIRPWAKPDSDVVYRSIVWDTHGCKAEGAPFQYVFVSGIGNKELDVNSFDIYPTVLDDAEKSLKIKSKERGEPFDLQVLDIYGRKVLNRSFQNTAETSRVNLAHVPNGVYMYVLHADGYKKKEGKIVIR